MSQMCAWVCMCGVGRGGGGGAESKNIRKKLEIITDL